MHNIEAILQRAVDPTSGTHHAVVFNAVDSQGNQIFSKAYGNLRVDRTGPKVTEDSVFWMASMSKLHTAVASMVAVEKGLLKLDDEVGKFVPELAEPDILVGFEEDAAGTPILRKAKNKITLRNLLNHTSGFTYDVSHPGIQKWSAFQGRTDNALMGSMDGYRHPLIFEPGEGWSYSPGMDWAGRVIEVLSGQSLDAFMKEHIWDKLAFTNTTFHPENHPALTPHLMEIGYRGSDNKLQKGPTPYTTPAKDDCGGVGLWSSPREYLKLLGTLLTGGGSVLSRASVEEIFTDQLKSNKQFMEAVMGPAYDQLGAMWPRGTQGTEGLTVTISWEDVPKRRAKGTANWGGMANTHYWIDRETGIAATLCVQIIPPGDPATLALLYELEEALYAEIREEPHGK